MSARPVRITIAVVVATAGWFVARAAPAAVPGSVARTGIAWRTPMTDGPYDLAVDGAGVVVTTSAPSAYLLDRHGRVRWRVPLPDLAVGQPALGRSVVVVGGPSSVTALDRTNGARRWTTPRAAAANSLAVAGDAVLVGDDSGTLAALDAATGVARWTVRYPGALWSGARVDLARGAVVATWHQSTSPAVRVLDLGSGALRWEAPTDRFTAAPSLHDDRVLLAIGDGARHARIESRDLANGALEWQTPVPASFEEAIEPAVDDGALAVVDHFGVVTVVDPATGRLRWQHDLADVLVATRVVLTGTRVALTTYAGVLHVLDRRDGHVVQTLAPRRLGGFPAAALRAPWGGGRVLVALRLRDWGVELRRLA